MVYVITGKYKKTPEMKAKGIDFHCNHFPEHAKVYDAAYKRKRFGKPVDGSFFKEQGERLKEMRAKGVR